MKTKKIAAALLALTVFVGAGFMGLPTASAFGENFAAISADNLHSLAVKADGTLWSWGWNEQGRLGDGTSVKIRAFPAKIMSDVKAVATGYNHDMAIKTDNTLWSWGANNDGELGNGEMSSSYEGNNKPGKIMTDVAAVTTGHSFTAAIKTDGTLWTWGNGGYGHLGDGSTENRATPKQVMSGVSAVSAGAGFTLAIKTDGSLWAWGFNYSGQLGIGTRGSFRDTPVKIMDDVAAVSAGSGHSMAIKTDGSLWAWGSNNKGALGTEEDEYSPVKIMDDVASVSAGSSHTMAIKKDGTLWGWGNNYDKQLGVSTGKAECFTPIPIDSISGVVAVQASEHHTLAIKSDGTLWGWGFNGGGQLGDGTNASRGTPVKIMDGVMLPTPQKPREPIDSASEWAKDSIKKAVAAGFVPSDLQGSYRNNISRGEFCRMAVAYIEAKKGVGIAAYLKEGDIDVDANAFTDTQDMNILSAYALGIVSGTGGGKFNPDGPITREQAAVMARNMQKALGIDVGSPPSAGFADADKISGWSKEAVDYVFANGIMNGKDGNTFDPKGSYTREQAIITFLRVFEK